MQRPWGVAEGGMLKELQVVLFNWGISHTSGSFKRRFVERNENQFVACNAKEFDLDS